MHKKCISIHYHGKANKCNKCKILYYQIDLSILIFTNIMLNKIGIYNVYMMSSNVLIRCKTIQNVDSITDLYFNNVYLIYRIMNYGLKISLQLEPHTAAK